MMVAGGVLQMGQAVGHQAPENIIAQSASPHLTALKKTPQRFNFYGLELLDTKEMRQATEGVNTDIDRAARAFLSKSSSSPAVPRPGSHKSDNQNSDKNPALKTAQLGTGTQAVQPSQTIRPFLEEETSAAPSADEPEGETTLKARIARELVAFAPSFQGDTRLDAVSGHLSERARSELTSYSRDVVDAWLHREIYGLLFDRTNGADTRPEDMTRSEKMLATAADHLALSFSETGQKLMGRVQDSAWQGEPGQAFVGLDSALREDVIGALVDSGEAMARASGIAALANMEFKYELENGGLSRWSALAVHPLFSSPDKRHNTFLQGSWFHGESRDFSDGVVRDTFNIGYGYRRMSDDEKHIYGVNIFYDHEFPYNHQRMSLGVEYLNSLIALRLNRYFRLSDYRDRDDGFQERALGGWDAEVSGRLPQIPSVEVFLRGYQWERDKTEFLNPTGKDIWGKELRVEYTPVPAFTVEAGLRDETDQGALEANIAARFNYRLGDDPIPQLTPRDSFALVSMADRRFEKVHRQNLIRKEIRINPDLVAQVITITGTLTVTPPTGPAFTASVGDRIRFDSTLAVSGGVGDIAEFLFGDGGFLRIGEGTQVAFRSGELELLTNGFLQYISGSTNVTLLSAGDSVSLIGTDVELRRDGDDTTLRVRDGAALIANAAGMLTLNVQEMGFVDDSATPVLVGRGAPAFDAHVTDAVNQMNLTSTSIASTKLAPYVPAAVAITGTAEVGQTLDFTVPTSQVVNVTGTPELVIDVGGTERRATYQSGSGSSSLLFQYTVLAGDSGATNIDASYIDYVTGSDIASSQGRRLVPEVTGTRAVTISIPAGAFSMTMDPTLGTDGTTATQVLIPTGTGTFNYDITWNQGSNNGSATGLTGDYTINLPGSGLVTVNITGQFPHMDSSIGRIGVTDVNQWGTNVWGSMANMFSDETGITTFSATDAPDLSGVTSMGSMFQDASSFNEDISSWDVSSVTNMFGIFFRAGSFNQDISGWNVSSVINMGRMFQGATSFDQDLSGWVVSSATDMNRVFNGATSFNQDISAWDVSGVTNMRRMFSNASSFNQDIGNWDVSSAITLEEMFQNATAFNHNLGGWDVSGITNMANMLDNSDLSRTNYDATLTGWAGQTVNSGVTLGAAGLEYCNAGDERQSLIDDDGWTITDAGLAAECPEFIITMDPTLGNDGSSSTQVIIHAEEVSGSYDFTWSQGAAMGSETGLTGRFTLNLPTSDPVTIRITHGLTYWRTPSLDNRSGITDVLQWGNTVWTNMRAMFRGETGITTFTASDAPDLSGGGVGMESVFMGASNFNSDINHWDVSNIGSFSSAFRDASSFNQDISGWDVANVTNMSFMFAGASAFNQDISGWNTASLQNMRRMFRQASSFNQPIGTWDTSNVDTMQNTFQNASAFNQDISGWNTGSVENMRGMFLNASSFNQDISGWDTSSVTIMQEMFGNAVAFDQNLSAWDISNVVNMGSMLSAAGLSTTNYDATLIGWANQAVQAGVNLGAVGKTYCNADPERQNLITTHSWTITDAGLDGGTGCPGFHVTIDSTLGTDGTTANQVNIPTGGGVFNYNVVWRDSGGNIGTFENLTASQTIDVPTSGAVDVRISGDFPHFTSGATTTGVTDVSQWGDIAWGSMVSMFQDETGVTVFSASDTPDLSSVTNMWRMFRDATSFNSNINNWDVSNITSLKASFWNADAFNQPLNSWDVSGVTDMRDTFNRARDFNQDITMWDVSNVSLMNNMFAFTVFNHDISVWDVSNVSDFGFLFHFASFNQDLGSWNLRLAGTSMAGGPSGIFRNTGISEENYSRTLIGWANYVSVNGGNPPNVPMRADTQQYNATNYGGTPFNNAVDARNYLTGTAGWTIFGDTFVP